MASLVGDTYRCLHTLATGNYRAAALCDCAETTLRVAYAVGTYFIFKALMAQMPTALMALGAFALLSRGISTYVDGKSVDTGAGFWMLTTGIQQIAQATLWQTKALGVAKLIFGAVSIFHNSHNADFANYPHLEAQSIVNYVRNPKLALTTIIYRYNQIKKQV